MLENSKQVNPQETRLHNVQQTASTSQLLDTPPPPPPTLPVPALPVTTSEPEYLSSYPSNSGEPHGTPGEKLYVDTYVSTEPPLVMLGPCKGSQGLKKLAKVGISGTTGFQQLHHHQDQSEKSEGNKITKNEKQSERLTGSELKGKVTPPKNISEESKVKKLAMRFDQFDQGASLTSGRQKIKNIEKKLFGRQPHREDIQKTLLVDALEQKCDDKNQVVFETNTVHVERRDDQVRSTFRRQPRTSSSSTFQERQPAVQQASLEGIHDDEIAAQVLYQKEIDKIKLPPNYLKRKETFAASNLIHGLTEQCHDVKQFCDNPMGDTEKL